MEQIVEQIFQRAEEHPEIIPDLKKNDGLLSTYDSELLDAMKKWTDSNSGRDDPLIQKRN